MKTLKCVMKVLAALAAVAGAVYLIAAYGDKLVAWAKRVIGCCPWDEGMEEEAPAAEETAAPEEAPAAEEPAAVPEEAAAAEEAPAEAPVEAPAEEEAPAEVPETDEPVADEGDFEG